jgi:hypothetical protein
MLNGECEFPASFRTMCQPQSWTYEFSFKYTYDVGDNSEKISADSY